MIEETPQRKIVKVGKNEKIDTNKIIIKHLKFIYI